MDDKLRSSFIRVITDSPPGSAAERDCQPELIKPGPRTPARLADKLLSRGATLRCTAPGRALVQLGLGEGWPHTGLLHAPPHPVNLTAPHPRRVGQSRLALSLFFFTAGETEFTRKALRPRPRSYIKAGGGGKPGWGPGLQGPHHSCPHYLPCPGNPTSSFFPEPSRPSLEL